MSATPSRAQAVLKALQDSGAAQTDAHSGSGLCTVPIAALVKLLDDSLTQQQHNKGNVDDTPAFLLLSVGIDGTTLDDCVLFKFTFEVSVLASSWTQVKLLPETVAIVSSSIVPIHDTDSSCMMFPNMHIIYSLT